MLSLTVLSGHFILLFILCLFGLHRLSMVYRWYKYKNVPAEISTEFNELPYITVQIPLYNERFVAERIINAVANFDYPKTKLQIQIVDDSTDDTCQLVADRVSHFQTLGINIHHVQRQNRQGFKAGALKEAMASATGEFIAIFDGDFIPNSDLLKKTIHHFAESSTDNNADNNAAQSTDKRLAMVQFRWQHLNRHDSELTQVQAMMLDAHFSLEQQVRYASKLFFNFNGTAGIWRTEAIIDAGHWSADTLTEDLDLSYRAQLKGWRMVYLNNVECAGELPANMNAFKSQQHRWAKGGVQVMKKMLPHVWRTKLPLKSKIEASFHLSNNLAYLVMLLDTLVFLVPSLWLRQQYQFSNTLWFDLPLLLLSSGGHLIYLYYGQIALGHSKFYTWKKLPRLLLLGIQLSINNARAGLEALLGQESEFVRTPKEGDLVHKLNSTKLNSTKYSAVPPRGALFELLVALIYSMVLFWVVWQQHWFMLPFIFILALGFLSTSISSIRNHYG
jgi:cellulose synthase/poly-beta-1,6-N-acetylglucosamine synthase-like glycosyltransferase